MTRADDLIQEAEFRRCRGSDEGDVEAFAYFCEKYAYIRHPKRGAIQFALRPAQYETATHWLVDPLTIVLKARQIGYSTLGAVYALWLCFFWSDSAFIMLSRNEREAKKLIAKANYAYRRMPLWMRDRGPKRLDQNVLRISFDNDSDMEALPSKEDPARGASAKVIMVDEWAFFDNAEDAWNAIEPAADVGGRIIALSTANGAGNFFHDMWLSAVQKINGFVPLFFPWHANSDRDDKWYAAQKRKLPAHTLAQEYPDNPEEAFLKSGHPVFDVDALRALPLEPASHRGSLSLVAKGIKEPTFDDHENGALRVWRTPEQGHTYVVGADVAEGLEHGDYSSVHVIDVGTNRVVAHWHDHIDADLFAEEIAKLGYWYNKAFVGVEVNNHGLTTNKSLQRLGYPWIYVRHELDSDTGQEDRQAKVGWYTSRVSKPLMIDTLRECVRDGLKIPDEHTVGEMLTFVRNSKGGMEGSPFDDRVMSLAVTVMMMPHAKKQDAAATEPEYYWSFNYFMDKLIQPDGEEYVPIGSYRQQHSFV